MNEEPRLEAERLYHLFADNITDVMWVSDAELRIVWVSPSIERLLGYTVDEFLRMTLTDVLTPESLRKGMELVASVPDFLSAEFEHRHKDGSLRWVEVNSKRLRDADGRPTGFMGVSRDITEWRLAREALQRSEALYHTTTDGLEEWLHVVDRDLRVVMMNSSFRRTCLALGVQGEVVGRMIGEIFPFLPDHIFDQYRQVFESGKSMTTIESTFINGRRYHTLTKKAPIFEGERVARVLTLIHDITEMRRNEEELEQYRKNLEAMVDQRTQELTETNRLLQQEIVRRAVVESDLREAKTAAEAASRAKGEFLANMSHEIRTPLNGVINMLRFLLGAELAAQQREFAELAFSSAESLLAVINDILDYSRIEAGRLNLESAPFNLQLLLEEAAQLLGGKAEEKGFELTVRYAPDAPRWACGDAQRVRQIVGNLLSNAVKFTSYGYVSVDGAYETADGGAFVISVEDSGVGIEEGQLDRLFEKFSQGPSAARQDSGAGLGLSIAKQLAEMMGGRIAVESRPGVGSRFAATLPLPSTPEPASTENLEALAGRRVLVVDASPRSRRVLVEEIERLRARASFVGDSSAALGELTAAAGAGAPYDVAIISGGLPIYDGLELARSIRARPDLRETRLALTATLAHLSAAKADVESRFDAYLARPVRQSRLLGSLAAVLRADGRAAAKAEAGSRGNGQLSLRTSKPIGAKVLLVEDDKINQVVARKLLEIFGCRVEVAGDGREAVALAATTPYDIVLMDARMPVMDGYEATQEIRRAEGPNRETPIIALTAHVLQGAREKCLEAGMNDYLPKPLDPKSVRTTLLRWCKGKSG